MDDFGVFGGLNVALYPRHLRIHNQDYVRLNPSNGYVRAVALPKVQKARKLFKDRLKTAAPTQP